MTVLYRGVLEADQMTANARGGTEQMRDRLIANVDRDLLSRVAIHFSRPKELYADVPNILYCHDMASDPAVAVLTTQHAKFDHFVFVSNWQRDEFINRFDIPHSKCSVIQNAVEREFDLSYEKSTTGEVKFIYHTTPHRGLQLVYAIFSELAKLHENIHLDVFSSFSVYGWEHRDAPYQQLFDQVDKHPNMSYHGGVSNQRVLDALSDAHVFLYPSIWKETSCIALIEAMKSGVLCIYPSYGALPETGAYTCNIGMYPYTEDLNQHAIRAFNHAHFVLEQHKKNPLFFKQIVQTYTTPSQTHSISTFRERWNTLLRQATEKVLT